MPIEADIKQIGCVPCLLTLGKTRPCDVHHPVAGMRRTGEMYGSCPWHHRGLVEDGYDKQSMMGLMGPSLTFGRRIFEDFFGPEERLVEVQEYLLEEWKKQSWLDYYVPYEIRRRAVELWKS